MGFLAFEENELGPFRSAIVLEEQRINLIRSAISGRSLAPVERCVFKGFFELVDLSVLSLVSG